MRYIATIDTRQIAIENVDLAAGSATVDGRSVRFDFQPLRSGLYSLILDDRVYTVQLQNGTGADEVTIGAHHRSVTVDDERAILLRKLAHAEENTGIFELVTPMPGLVIRVNARSGDAIKKGQRLVTVEAMKMENEIKSPVDGVVEQVFVVERDIVEKGTKLLRVNKNSSNLEGSGS
jgi:biotin carboxyl carrier protein